MAGHDPGDDRLQAAVSASIAGIEEDCSKSWPRCTRGPLICDCRLRAVRAINAMKQATATADGFPAGCFMTLAVSDTEIIAYGIPFPGIPVKGMTLVYVHDLGTCWEVLDVQVSLTMEGSISRRDGSPLLADVMVRKAESLYARYPDLGADETGVSDGG